MRDNYISWDEFFMGIAKMAAHRSKDDRVVNGACIVNGNNRIVGVGYNGFPDDLVDTPDRWQKPQKYDHIIHAEDNAIKNAIKDLSGCTLYLWSQKNYIPCQNCAKEVVDAGITKVIVSSLPVESDMWDWEEAELLFKKNDIELKIVDINTDICLPESKPNNGVTLSLSFGKNSGPIVDKGISYISLNLGIFSITIAKNIAGVINGHYEDLTKLGVKVVPQGHTSCTSI